VETPDRQWLARLIIEPDSLQDASQNSFLFFSREARWKQTKKILLILDTAVIAAHNEAYSHKARRKSKRTR
jgi:hypothetical protein